MRHRLHIPGAKEQPQRKARLQRDGFVLFRRHPIHGVLRLECSTPVPGSIKRFIKGGTSG